MKERMRRDDAARFGRTRDRLVLDFQLAALVDGVEAGGAELLIAYGAPRCAMITIDPDTAKRDAQVLRTVAQRFGNAFTMYASIARPGVLREGDEVRFVGP